MSYFEDMSSHATFLLQPPSRTRGMSNKSSQENCFDCSMKGQLMVNEPIRNNGEGSVSISINEIGSKYWVGDHCLCRCYEFLAMNTAESAIMCFKVARHFESPGLCPR